MRKLLIFALLIGAALWHRSERPPRIATFNIERFGAPEKRTDDTRLVALLDSLDADVLAVQEIEDPRRLARVVERLGRRYALSQCGGASGMRVGFVYDPARVELESVREYPELDPRGEGACTRGERPGLVGRFSSASGRFALLAVHLAARGDEEFANKRRAQWRRAIEIVSSLDVPAAILGDTNSTGWLDDKYGERSFIEGLLRAANLRLVTGELGCSEYWEHDGRLEPSLLDHIAVTAGFPARAAAVHGYCAQLACRAIDAARAPDDYRAISDHCPVTAE